MHLVGFEPTILTGERSQTYALDRAATGTHVWQVVTGVSDESLLLVCLNALKREAVASFGTLIRCITSDGTAILFFTVMKIKNLVRRIHIYLQ